MKNWCTQTFTSRNVWLLEVPVSVIMCVPSRWRSEVWMLRMPLTLRCSTPALSRHPNKPVFSKPWSWSKSSVAKTTPSAPSHTTPYWRCMPSPTTSKPAFTRSRYDAGRRLCLVDGTVVHWTALDFCFLIEFVLVFAGDAAKRPCCDPGDISLPADGLFEGQRNRIQTGSTGRLSSPLASWDLSFCFGVHLSFLARALNRNFFTIGLFRPETVF